MRVAGEGLSLGELPRDVSGSAPSGGVGPNGQPAIGLMSQQSLRGMIEIPRTWQRDVGRSESASEKGTSWQESPRRARNSNSSTYFMSMARNDRIAAFRARSSAVSMARIVRAPLSKNRTD